MNKKMKKNKKKTGFLKISRASIGWTQE